MKPFFLQTVFILMLNIFSQQVGAQSFSWAQAFTSTSGLTTIFTMAFDANNNVYSVGQFSGTVDVDASSNTHNLTAVGNRNMFLLKEDAAGNFIWAKAFIGLSSTVNGIYPNAIDFDASGNIYIAGSVQDSFDMDPDTDVYNFSTGGAVVAFILKLDSLGNFVWMRAHQVPSIINNASGIQVKIAGNTIYAVGNFLGTVDIDPGAGITNVTSVGGTDLLLIKLDTAGNFIWGKTMGGTGAEHILSLATDSYANLYVAGDFQNTVDFDPGTGMNTLTSAGNFDIFVAKYDSAGNYLWAKRVGSGNNDKAFGIAVDRWGNVVVTGSFEGVADFNPGAGTYNLTPNSSRSIFTLKLRNNGDFVWAQKAGYSTGLYESSAIATDTTGNVYVSAFNFYASYPLQKLDSSGNLVWTLSTPGVNYWAGLDKDNAIYLSGSFTGTQDFDPGSGVYNLTAASPGGGFILKLHYDSTFTSIHNLGTSGAALKVYPNPGNGIFTFTSSTRMEQLIITDMTGKAIYRAQPNKNEYITDLSGHAAGIYFYQITTNKGKENGKLILGNKE